MLPARTLLLLGLAAAPLACQSPELNLQLDQLRTEVALLRLQLQMAQADASPAAAHSRNLQARRAQLVAWLEEARRTMTDEHPRVREVQSTLAQLDREIANQARGPR